MGAIPILDPQGTFPGLCPADIDFGKPSPSACEATLSWIRTAVELAVAGGADAVCTCPINKEQLHRQGFAFAGHTEFIRELTGAQDAVMMLCGPRLRVALATIHEPLADVPALITKELLRRVIQITADSLVRDFAVKSPRIAVAGLNPHAGEAGRFGRAEIEVIGPVVEELRLRSASPGSESLESKDSLARDPLLVTRDSERSEAAITGPWPADTVFRRAASGEFDAVIAMYHDQGLIPIKLLHFNEAVNVTLGLPIVRTSVDHGTAYDIAGTGAADPGSLIEAVRLAAVMAVNRAYARKS
jgi:4-hydroxythreonine-4-phosphate dehydrogenase